LHIHPGEASPPKDAKNAGRSGNVYENKGTDDNLPEKKDDIYAYLYAILHRNAGILRESSPLLPLFERCRANPSFQNAETRAPAFPAARFESLPGNTVLRLE
jgi:hypothetical protein